MFFPIKFTSSSIGSSWGLRPRPGAEGTQLGPSYGRTRPSYPWYLISKGTTSLPGLTSVSIYAAQWLLETKKAHYPNKKTELKSMLYQYLNPTCLNPGIYRQSLKKGNSFTISKTFDKQAFVATGRLPMVPSGLPLVSDRSAPLRGT